MRADLVKLTEARRRDMAAHLDNFPAGLDALALMQHYAITQRVLKRDLDALFGRGLVCFYRNGLANAYVTPRHLAAAKAAAAQRRQGKRQQYERDRAESKREYHKARRAGEAKPRELKPVAWPMPPVSVWHFAEQVAA